MHNQLHIKKLLPFLLLLATTSFGQSKAIAIHNLDHQLLESVIKRGIDSVRRTKDLPPLQWDSVLSMAARDHSAYMNIKHYSGHDQRWRKKRDPTKRVEFYGGNGYLVGENVAMIPLYATSGKNGSAQGFAPYAKTYDQAAWHFVTTWVNSKGHYANIINPAYALTGLGVAIDKVHHTVHATHVLSQPNQNASISPGALENSTLSELRMRKADVKPKRKSVDYRESLTYKLRPYDSSCHPCDLNFGRGTLVFTEGNKIFLTTFYGTHAFIGSLEKKNDGYAAEVVNYSAFSIGNDDWHMKPTRRNGQSPKSGRMTPPFYREQILSQLQDQAPFKGNKRLYKTMLKGLRLPASTYPFPIKVQIGEVPPGFLPGSPNEINTVFIRGGQICKVSHGSNYCGDDFKLFVQQPYQSHFEYGPLRFDPVIDSITIQIPFERNSADFKKPAFTSTIKNKAMFQKEIIDIRSDIHASVEGTDAINRDLIKRRTESISEYVWETFPKYIHTVDTAVAWDSFYRLIRQSAGYRSWANLRQDEIVRKLNSEPIPAEIDSILYKTRKASLTIRFKATEVDTAVILYDRLLKGLKNIRGQKDIPYDEVRRLNIIFTRLHHMSLRGKIDTEKLLKVDIPQNPALVRLQSNQTYLLIQQYKNPTPTQLSMINNKLKMTGNEFEKWHNNEAIYNLLNFSVEHYDDNISGRVSLDRMIELFGQFTGVNKDSLGMNLHFLCSWYFGKDRRTWAKRDESVAFLYNFFVDKPMTDEFVNRLAGKYFFSHLRNYAEATLRRYALRENPNHEILINYLKASFQHYEYPTFECLDDPAYVEDLLRASSILSADEWCGMISGRCNISFEVLDFERVKDKYCEICEKRDDEILRGN